MFAAAGIGDRKSAGHSNTGSAFDRAFRVHDVPALSHQVGDELIGCPNFLESDDIGLALGQPVMHALAGGGSEAIDVDSCDSQHPPIVSRSEFGLVRLGR